MLMHRLRKKSDAPSQIAHSSSSSIVSYDTDRPPELPSAEHFRTSLILPELARRFTLLRTPTGDPVSLEDLRQRFAVQRARGGPDQISETEEDMLLETLGRIRSKSTTSNKTDHHEPNAPSMSAGSGAESDYTPERSSNYSNNTSSSSTYPASSPTSSPSSRSAKRYSNNLFSSGRLRDYSYLRSISQKSGSNRSAASITPTDSSQSLREGASLISSDSLRPVTPEESGHDSSTPSSPNEKTPVARSVSLVSSNEDVPPRAESGDHPHTLEGSSTASCQRTSAAVAQVFKEIEEEAEDEIVMPRTSRTPRPDTDRERVSNDTRDQAEIGTLNHSSTHLHYEAGTAISSDKQIVVDPSTHRMSPIPTGRPGATSPRLPGYVPGMPRPMTPRDPILDDDIRSHSTTPRAMSPNQNGHVSQLSSTSFTSGPLRRGSDASRSTPRPTSPPYTSSTPYSPRNLTGRRTPDESQRDSTSGTEQEGPGSSLFLRRRPVSPLTSTTFQPMAVSPRPSTPSNVTWNVGPAGKSESRSMHSRNGSLTDTDFSVYADSSKSLTMSTHPSDAPVTPNSVSTKWSRSASPAISVEYRSPSSLSGYDVGSPLSSSHTLRSPTPTQSRNVASPAFTSSDPNPVISRTSKQHASNFSLGSSQLSLSPLANSSRSSLESTGSSYHSESGQAKRQTAGIFINGVGQAQPAWHDLDKSNSTTPSSSQEGCDFEDIVRRYAGLTKSDFFAIQERLVGAAVQKSSYPDTRERANSLRRRRPSTSQSNYSVNGKESRVASPQPVQSATPGTRSPAPDNNAKANALLESVVGSIPPITLTIDDKVESKPPSEVSPTTRRNRDLARALGFGTEEEDNGVVEPTLTHEPEPSSSSVSLTVEAILPHVPYPDEEEVNPPAITSPQPEHIPLASSPSPNPNLQRSTSVQDPRSIDKYELEKEVQRKAEAATAALMKTTSGQKFTEANSSMVSVTRKRISPSQISTPVLVSAPTSMETIPLPQAGTTPPSNTQSSLGITQRVRRFRDTLRVKPAVSSVEEISSPPTDQQAQNNTSSGLRRRPTLPKFSPPDPAKSKIPPSNTQASTTTPGLKGLIARFRKPKTSETHGDSHSSNRSRTSPSDSSPTASASSHRGNSVATLSMKSGGSSSAEATARPATVTAALNSEMDSAAVKQLFDAASNLGLDKVALNDLLARSTSVSRATGWGLSAGSRAARGTKSPTPTRPVADNVDQTLSVTPEDKPNDDVNSTVNGADDRTVRAMTMRKPVNSTPSDQGVESPAVVRRTLIFPSDFRTSKVDASQSSRRHSMKKHRRSSSATSAQSARSVHDRAPTPPPPKTNGARRLSTDRSPPVPSMATSITAQAEALLRGPTGGVTTEKSNSAYESLYDMYSGENKHASTLVDDSGRERGHDSTATQEGTAVEVVEMANGETIWSIVNGLREDDVESFNASRTSSPDCARENRDDVQIFVKEHARSTSKGSSSSFSLKKAYQGKNRPETKIYYSSSAQIGRLIENLSQGMDSGSFNFIPNHHSDRSSPSSFQSGGDGHWTVEERLEQLLGAMRDP